MDYLNTIVIPEQMVQTSWIARMKPHYIKLGYQFTGIGAKFRIDWKDLSESSHVKIKVQCPKCKEFRQMLRSSVTRYGHTCCRLCTIQIKQRDDLTGKRFNRLTVIEFSHKNSSRALYWKCICDCGNKIVSQASPLRSGRTKSCGCYTIDRLKANTKENHPRWNFGLTDEERENICQRLTDEYILWRNGVYARDNWTCQICDTKLHKTIIAHHLYSYTGYPNLRLEPDNGVVLCEDCHRDFHGKHGYSRNTAEQFYEWENKKLAELEF